VSLHGCADAMQQRFSNVESVVAVPNVISTVAHEPAPGAQHGVAAPGVQAALFASVQVAAVEHTPVTHVSPPHE